MASEILLQVGFWNGVITFFIKKVLYGWLEGNFTDNTKDVNP